MAALDWITCAAAAAKEFVVSQVRFEADASRHATVLLQHTATLFEPPAFVSKTTENMCRDGHPLGDVLPQRLPARTGVAG
jgi:hypothetical protein